jgi:predicted dehydrogenase
MRKIIMKSEKTLSRRNFIKQSAYISGGALLTAKSGRLFAADSDQLGIAIVGAGDRGTYDLIRCLHSSSGIALVAMADMFEDQLDKSVKRIRTEVLDREKVKITPDTMYLGFDAYKKVLAMKEVDLVLLTTPPGFRPQMVRAAIEAGKHIFMEKPGAVDPVGVRSLLESTKLAKQKGLAIGVGFQQRWMKQYIQLLDHVKNGKIGEVASAQAYWAGDMVKWHWQPRKPEWSDMEWQIRCWPYFTWLSGDCYVEQMIHNLDTMNWMMGSTPVSCFGMGGRSVRTGPEFGNIYDHFTVEYEYPNGMRNLAMSGQMAGTTNRVSNRIEGTKGWGTVDRGSARIEGEDPWKFEEEQKNPEEVLFADLINSIREGKPINNGKIVAEASMTAIMGRTSAYTGRELKWDWIMNASKLDLTPAKYELGPLPVAPVSLPGQTALI